MMKGGTVHKLSSAATTPRSPERQRLADALAEYHVVGEQLKAARSVNWDSLRIVELSDVVDAKRKALEELPELAAKHLAALAQGKQSVAPMASTKAKAELQEAEDALQAARDANAAAETEAEKIAGTLDFLQIDVHRAFDEALKSDPNIAAIVRETEKAKARFLALCGVLNASLQVHGIDGRPRGFSIGAPSDLMSFKHEQFYAATAGQSLFGAALAALLHDPDAQIPTVDELLSAVTPQRRPAA